MDRLKSLSILIRVVELGSFSKCAEEFGVGQPTISRVLEDLEQELGLRLLTRTTRSLSLTEEGKEVLAEARKVIDSYNELLQKTQLKSSPKGAVRVTCPAALGSMYLIPAINEFMRLYPDIKIHLRITDTYLDLVDDDIDVALRVGDLKSNQVVAKYVGSLPRIGVASEVYLRDKKTPTFLSELAGHSCIAVSKTASNLAWEGVDKAHYNIDGKFIVDNYLALQTAVHEGLGIGIGGRFLFEEKGLLRKGLVQVLKKVEFRPYPVNFVFKDAKNLPMRTRLFIDYFFQNLQKQGWFEK